MQIKSYSNGAWTPHKALGYENASHDFKPLAIKPIRREGIIGCMLDCGRKYFTVAWVKPLIDLLAQQGYNTLFLHFSEDMGLRIESVQYPWLAGSDDDLCVVQGITDPDEGEYWTQTEVLDIVAYATAHHIEIIPSFDCPAHCNYIVKKYNEHYNEDIGNYYHYNNQTHIVEGSGNTAYSRGIDISNPAAVSFLNSLITEYALLFYGAGCRNFDIGGDEILGWGTAVTTSVPKWQQLEHWKSAAVTLTGDNNATAYDYFIAYLNGVADTLLNLGYERIFAWNDNLLRSYDTGYTGVVQMSKNINVMYWTNDANNGLNTPMTYMQHGYSIINALNTYNYYVTKSGYTEPTETLIKDWTKENYEDYVINEYEERNKGGCFCIWCDSPAYMTEAQIRAAVEPLLIVRMTHTASSTSVFKIGQTSPSDVSIYQNVGYKEGYRLSSSGAENALESHAVTGYIPIHTGDTIYFNQAAGFTTTTNTGNNRYNSYFSLYNADGSQYSVNGNRAAACPNEIQPSSLEGSRLWKSGAVTSVAYYTGTNTIKSVTFSASANGKWLRMSANYSLLEDWDGNGKIRLNDATICDDYV